MPTINNTSIQTGFGVRVWFFNIDWIYFFFGVVDLFTGQTLQVRLLNCVQLDVSLVRCIYSDSTMSWTGMNVKNDHNFPSNFERTDPWILRNRVFKTRPSTDRPTNNRPPNNRPHNNPKSWTIQCRNPSTLQLVRNKPAGLVSMGPSVRTFILRVLPGPPQNNNKIRQSGELKKRLSTSSIPKHPGLHNPRNNSFYNLHLVGDFRFKYLHKSVSLL